MKKSIYLYSTLLSLAIMAGCSDWGEEPEMNILELESAHVSFDAYGGAGDIVVKSAGSITASCSDSWCTTDVSGNKVTVTVPACGELMGRATVVTVVSGVKKVQVPVMQSGVLIDCDRTPRAISNKAYDTTLLVHAPVPVTVTSSATWLVPSISGATMHIHADDNPTFAVRVGTLTLSAGSFTLPITITQQAISDKLLLKDYAGTWTLTHTSATIIGVTKYNKTAIVAASGKDTLRVTLSAGTATSATFTFFMNYNAVTGKVNIPVQKVFEDGAHEVILAGSSGSLTEVTINNGGMAGMPTDGTPAKPVLTFTDNQTGNKTYTYTGFTLRKVDKTSGANVGEYTGFGSVSTSRYIDITMTKQ
jgi:hypothetical protein